MINECEPTDEFNKDSACLLQLAIQANAISTQTKSKSIVRCESIQQSLVQLLVHLLSRLALNSNQLSLHQLLETARARKDTHQMGDGTVHLSRLLVKLERLSDECKLQIDEAVNELEVTPPTSDMAK